MRYATVLIEGQARWGRVVDDKILLLDALHPTLKAAIAAGALASGELDRAAGEAIDLSAVRFLPPITEPGKILCIGLNYENHRRETGRAEVAHPTVFTRFPDSQVGHEAAILRPPESIKLDYEGELAVVIGKGGRRIAAVDALDHIAGYSCYNDGSVRDWQAHTIQFTPGKNFPQTGAFGPWLVTPDEFGPPATQTLQTRLNGQVMQHARLADMIFPIDQLIAYCSTFTPIAPGDVIVTGTPGGVGAKRDPQVFMKPGDTVEIEIDGIGVLANVIADEPAAN
ncbi:fumarylacetoacetate hydrolase family protein [Sphingomonas profundi]|uniref:fumarylacetoacetate hydrolase family protein n=1 Tax=Alterirhizorhabdus profundi TaxID=2681549 RepID=UPI0012E7602D|nr:fumarylacetoacetate hydrolase family protein [Sphingomonas profundi]